MRNLSKHTFPLLALSSAFLLSAAWATDSKKPDATPAAASAPAATFTVPDPVATVNGTPIPKATFDQYAQRLGTRVQTETLEGSKSLIEQLVTEELLVQEANKQKLADDPEVKEQMAMIQRNVLANTVLRRLMAAHPPSEEAIKKEYETAVSAMKGKEYKASHILVDSEDKAKEIIEELKKDNSKFAELAKTKSSDSSAANGGDLGWFTPSMMVPPFAQAVTQMEKGKFSDAPVKTPFGWHVIFLEDIRDATPPSLDELKPQIAQMLQSKQITEYLEKLKSGAQIQLAEIKVNESKSEAARTERPAHEEKKTTSSPPKEEKK